MSMPEHIEAQHHTENQERIGEVEEQVGAVRSEVNAVRSEMRELKNLLDKLGFDFHALKGALAANTSFTMQLVDQQRSDNMMLMQKIEAGNQATQALAASTAGVLELYNNGLGAVRTGVGFRNFVIGGAKFVGAVSIFIGIPTGVATWLAGLHK